MHTVTIPARTVNLVLFGLFLLVAIAGYIDTATFPRPVLKGYPGAAMLPRLVLIGMGLFSLLGLIRTLRDRALAAKAPMQFELGPFVWIVLSLTAFALALEYLGMEVAVLGFIGGAIWLRTRRAGLAVAVGLASVAVVYLLFVQALSVHMPLTVLPRYPGVF